MKMVGTPFPEGGMSHDHTKAEERKKKILIRESFDFGSV